MQIFKMFFVFYLAFKAKQLRKLLEGNKFKQKDKVNAGPGQQPYPHEEKTA